MTDAYDFTLSFSAIGILQNSLPGPGQPGPGGAVDSNGGLSLSDAVRVYGKKLFGVHPIALGPHSEERLGEVLSLALGIGANTAIFSVFDALLLKTLPVKDPQPLVPLKGQYSYPYFQAVRQGDVFRDVFATSGVNEQNVEIENAPAKGTTLSLVSGAYFSVLGVPTVENDQSSYPALYRLEQTGREKYRGYS